SLSGHRRGNRAMHGTAQVPSQAVRRKMTGAEACAKDEDSCGGSRGCAGHGARDGRLISVGTSRSDARRGVAPSGKCEPWTRSSLRPSQHLNAELMLGDLCRSSAYLWLDGYGAAAGGLQQRGDCRPALGWHGGRGGVAGEHGLGVVPATPPAWPATGWAGPAPAPRRLRLLPPAGSGVPGRWWRGNRCFWGLGGACRLWGVLGGLFGGGG